MIEGNSFISKVEALILASPEPIPAKRVAQSVSELTPAKVVQAVGELNERYSGMEASFRIREVAGGYQFYILPDYTRFVEELFTRRRKMRLTRAALETLAIVAYKQPVSKVDIEHIRGVSSDGVIHNLLEKKLINIKGRAESPGRPLQYATTDEFLKFFGINRLEDLPEMSEIEELIKAAGPSDLTEFNVEAAPGETACDGRQPEPTTTVDSGSNDEDNSGCVQDLSEETKKETTETVEHDSEERVSLTLKKERELEK